jgi:phosphomannomutase
VSGAHHFDPTILREYDIRGIVGGTLTLDDARSVGRSFGTVCKRAGGQRVCLGYDGRDSSPAMADAVADGLMACGLDVVRIGLGPTPMLYFSVYTLGACGGIMVTGSHNPPDYNGFKMMLGPGMSDGAAFYGEAIQALGRIAAEGDFETGAGSDSVVEVFDRYVDHLAAEFGARRGLSAVWDAGNGAAGPAMAALAARLPGTHRCLFADVDGSFPNHHRDPTVPANLADLMAAVRESDADVGLAFDGDGDRIGVVDGAGRVLWADQLMVLFARDLLAKQPGATVIADVKASQVLFDEIARAGGNPHMYKTGHSLIKARMKAVGAPLAGEMSGHIFFADRNFGYDDGLYAAVRLLRILADSGESLAAFHDALPKVLNTPELRFPCAEERKRPVIAEVQARLKEANAQVDDTDGVRVLTEDGWWLLRASNTQDVLVARCEARDAAGLDRLKAQLAEQLEGSDIAVPDFG